MKAIELIRATMRDNVVLGNNVKDTVVCGSVEPNRWYYIESTPTWGKADCVMLDPDKQPVYLYLIEE